MRSLWERRIDRADRLAAEHEPARSLLVAYGRLLRLQRDCYETLLKNRAGLSGSLESDLPFVRACAAPILSAIVAHGPPKLADEGRQLLAAPDAVLDSMLLSGWRAASGQPFFARVLLQPYAQLLAEIPIRAKDRGLPASTNTCPFCSGVPQLSILHSAGESDGGGRQLVCAMCSTAWPFPRLRCAHCGEDDEHRLGYFHSPAFDHLRVDACDSCRHYLKTVDLTRLGLAVPLVDEVAAAPLDLWARENGYEKIELNLVGL